MDQGPPLSGPESVAGGHAGAAAPGASPPPKGSTQGGKVLTVMLERLFAAIAGGPSLNCRPHSSRQRVDLCALESLRDLRPGAAFQELLSDKAETRIVARVKAPPIASIVRSEEPPELREQRQQHAAQQQLISKMRILVDEARTYEEDTGVHVLNVGFPLLHLPPGVGGRRGATGRRIIAPIAFIPVSLSVQGGAAPAVDIACQSDEVDCVVPNEALLAWIEQQTGKAAAEMNADDDGSNPWREIAAIVRHVCSAMEIATPEMFVGDVPPESLELRAVPKTDNFGPTPEIILGGVLGLFPASRQGLIRDTKDMVRDGAPAGPVKRFLSAAAAYDSTAPKEQKAESRPAAAHTISSDSARLVAPADPCQASAVAKARTEDALVIHGPPGTGKSQTITNIIGDALVRGQRVLFVCEKRTALDVVANRLEAIGLGNLCAVIHDPQRDQKNLYMSVREQLDGLADQRPREGVERTVERLDAELMKIHGELTEFRTLLNVRDTEGRSLHELVGKVLELTSRAAACPIEIPSIPGVGPEVVEAAAVDIRETLSRGVEVHFIGNPWNAATGTSLAAYLALPGDRVRQQIGAIAEAGRAADATAEPRIPPFAPAIPLAEQAAARTALADELDKVYALPQADLRRWWATKSNDALSSAARTLTEIAPAIANAAEGPLDAELLMTMRASPLTIPQLAQGIGSLEAYIASTKSILGFLAFGKRKAAGKVLSPLGLPLTPDTATRAKTFMSRLRSLLVLRSTLDAMRRTAVPAGIPDRDSTLTESSATTAIVGVLSRAQSQPALAPVASLVGPALAKESPDTDLIWGLRASTARANALASLEQAVTGSGLIAPQWAAATQAQWRSGEPASPTTDQLQSRLPTLEGVLRVKEGVATMRPELRPHILRLLEAGADDEAGLDALMLACTSGRVAALIESSPKLHAADARRVQTRFTRWRELEAQRREAVRDLVVSRWTSRQRERLVVATGSRLNSDGAKVRQRLITRGARALRLRQVLALGREVEGGDPIFDLRPVWMASPETVAQVFPREPVFDIVIFDEASQCRLEDALPVLTRARRVVIAGDPKQLPPTRFFESGAATSDEEPIATDDQLFEAQQTQVEDLLSAALNLALAESYLDVHYRSRNSDLIEFSNEHFYSKRLQAIPGHPRNRPRVPPLNLWRVDGVYEDRQNEREALEVVRIVRDLLKRAAPPSIGIACFNLTQRDLIVEKLDEAAEEDPQFASKLAIARSRRSGGAPDGLFVKNLENVQGDERDHIIISTTYGRDPTGKFHRRFGPLLQPGGGRRLNVLVTRARHEIHLVTSIPREAYLSLPEIPMGAAPGGGWLLLSYLRYAEDLRELYTQAGIAADEAATRHAGVVQRTVLDSAAPSPIATQLGAIFEREKGIGSVVHWGNDGFCVDVALRHPQRPLDVTCGVLCDFARYAPGQDAIEWDIFRSGILESQGWHLERLWSPAVFRDPKGCIDRILAAADRIGREEYKSDELPVVKPLDEGRTGPIDESKPEQR